jgi:hypothetical protein
MLEIQPPNTFSHIDDNETFSIFLAGSIELNTASRWQDKIKEELKSYDIAIYNPRRNDWDNSIKQTILDTRFREQVDWELNAIQAASLVIFYFDPNTKSPISLLELGLCAAKRNVVVSCPTGFWRKGNVEMVCHRFKIPIVNSLDDLISRIKLILHDVNVPKNKA